MNVQAVFNAFLLTLSLATIMLTLASFFLYKLRQLPQKAAGGVPSMRLDGVFFRRYYPLEALPKPAPAPQPSALVAGMRKPLAWITRSAQVFFVLVILVIFLSLAAQDYFGGIFAEKARVRSAEDIRKLADKGLLREHDFAEMDATHVLDETILPSQEKTAEALRLGLVSRRIALVELPSSRQHNGPRHKAGLEAWTSFLNVERIPFQRVQDIPPPGRFDLVAVPQAKALGEASRAALEKLVAGGTSVIATGPVGLLNGLGQQASGTSWAEKLFGVSLVPNEESESYFPSLFSGRESRGFDVPAGLLIRDFPSDNSVSALAAAGASVALEANYRGTPHLHGRVPITRAQVVAPPADTGRGRTLWLAADPMSDQVQQKLSLTDADAFYLRAFLLGVSAWAARVPTAVVSPWKDGKPMATVVSVDTEDHFENGRRLASAFRDLGFPATFFVVSRLYRKHAGTLDDAGPDAEIASHSEDHSIFENQEPFDQFNRLQDGRLEAEEIAGTAILGFRPPLEKFDEGTIVGALQNRFRYFYGDRRHKRFSPVWVASGKLLFFSRAFLDDTAIQRRRVVPNPEEAMALFRADAESAELLGGAYLLALHTQTFGEKDYDKPLRGLLKELAAKDAWRTNFRSLYEWWKTRSRLEVELKPTGGGKFLLTVKNASDLPASGLWLKLDLGSPAVSVNDPKIASLQEGGKALALAAIAPGGAASLEITTR